MALDSVEELSDEGTVALSPSAGVRAEEKKGQGEGQGESQAEAEEFTQERNQRRSDRSQFDGDEETGEARRLRSFSGAAGHEKTSCSS